MKSQISNPPLPTGRQATPPLPKEGQGGFMILIWNPRQWYRRIKEVGMILRILIGVVLGGAAGFGLSYLSRGIGSS
jgi:hypothetical protein